MFASVVALLPETPRRSKRAAAEGNAIGDMAALRRRRLVEEEARRLSMMISVATSIERRCNTASLVFLLIYVTHGE